MWRFAKAQARGSSHQKLGIPCQDKIYLRVLDGETFIAAVADGAGSALYSDIGAGIVVNTVVSSILKDIYSKKSDFVNILRNAAKEAINRLHRASQIHGVEVRQFATTLLAVVIGPIGGGALQIGDGVIVVKDVDGWSWIFWPQHGEYANTTYFLTDNDAMNFLQIEPIITKINEIALTTDGLESLVLHYNSQTVHEPFFDGIFEPLLNAKNFGEVSNVSEMLRRFFSSERIRERTDDDISLIMATRRS